MSFTRKFYIADCHFGHASIIRSCNRPFASVEEMDAEIVRRWNAVVRPGDLVYHLGDWGWPTGGDAERFRALFHSLHGRKVLVLGNHDTRKDGSLRADLAELPWDRRPEHLLEVKDEGCRVVLGHYAQRTWNAAHHGAWHFYGHSHGRLPPLGRSRDVGVDCPDVDFTPRSFNELTAGIVANEISRVKEGCAA